VALGDLAGGLPALAAQRERAAPQVLPQGIGVPPRAQFAEDGDHLGQAAQPGVLPAAAQMPARRSGHDDLVMTWAGGAGWHEMTST
jgi:hypothetical protein